MATGKSVLSHRIGDHVAGFVQGGTFPDYGAYAEYVRTPAELTWVVPEGTLNHDEAAALGCAYVVFSWLLGCLSELTDRFWTAVQALYNPTRLGLVEPPSRVDGEEWVFIYGGSSKSLVAVAQNSLGIAHPNDAASVGQYATQLAHLSGYKVATVASPRNFDLCKSLGADFVTDYHEPDAVQKIKDATGDSVVLALDTISLAPSQAFASKVIKPDGGKVVLLLGPDGDGQVREDVVLQRKPACFYSLYALH